jgi:excisionase family DNA binding protein
MESETYLTPAAAAVYLACSKSFLAKLRVYGRGPLFLKIGKAVRYRRSDLDEWVAASCRRSTSEDPSDRVQGRKAA